MTDLSRTNISIVGSLFILGLLGLLLFQSQPVAAKSFAENKYAAPTATATSTPTKQIFRSVAAQDGWILESSENSNIGGSFKNDASLSIGDNLDNKQYRSILSFNTSAIPDNAIITHVTLKIKQGGVTGQGNLFVDFNGILLDVKTGAFGLPALESSDFQAVDNQSFGPSKPLLTATWYNISLNQASARINKLSSNYGLTQIRLRFKRDDNNNHAINLMHFYSGNSTTPLYYPQLVVTYQLP